MAGEVKQSCRTCKYLDIQPNARGRIVASKAHTYRCLAPDPEMPLMPESITTRHGFRWFDGQSSRTYMGPDNGTECPVYERREKEVNNDGNP